MIKLFLALLLVISLATAFVLQEIITSLIYGLVLEAICLVRQLLRPVVTSKHASPIIKFANDASSLYKNDINANLQYIKLMRDTNFG